MIGTFLVEHFIELSTLAQTWLAAGATSFSVHQNNQVVASWPNDQSARGTGLCAPIVVEHSELGCLHISGINTAGAQLRLNTDARLVAGLLHQSSQLHQANEMLSASHDQLLAAYDTLRDIHDQASIEQLLRWLAGEAMRLTGAEGSFALLVPAKSAPILVMHPTFHLSEEIIWSLYWRNESDPHFTTGNGLIERAGLPATIRETLLVKTRLEPEIVLLLGLMNRSQGVFNPRDYRLAHVIAQQTGSRIAQKLQAEAQVIQTRLQGEIELARRVQTLLMPQSLPQVHGLDVFGQMRPALPVGGDFYDFIDLPDRPFLFSVGDVVGKGFSAAMLMTMTRGAIHSKASFMPNPSPASVMRNSNSDLCADFSQVGTFATALVGQYDASERALILANAGHSPVIYRPAGGTPQLLRARSTALGLLAVNQCENEIFNLGPDDLLVVGTDGLSDARNQDGEYFGFERMLDLIDLLAKQPAQAISEGLFNAVDRFAEARAQDDDQTLVVIKGTDA
ncbi:MAG: PP2C family protein-serine/threonine phosphatase [Oscillochloris sp.]|nr:PP2C family protein-serine/threonine phosphatase [Oscillochloris sp.]